MFPWRGAEDEHDRDTLQHKTDYAFGLLPLN